ncbi:hypothetical protein DNL87_22085 [Salmonella enterica subsp. enterica serovar Schwarzengrund]|nr:hypothetical protein [Salmonella enterica subsp. enterica serovar Schwarzengrund]EBS6219761.1 hypothetical protein [Salmonella enterica subsp. enterica serovar Schwarzengrund]EBV0358157.1 hypothetical protein [Salmonella enterica subsp. enterica serovar Schwarzengrund]EBY5526753.1 hypothetical protein [Salmonella enterica subsp. enterica serovar Schwarzengrund]EBZ0694829.1 hypothetical protein [Salmonella enterica subsp. enterica serovar Schwarzengrund]
MQLAYPCIAPQTIALCLPQFCHTHNAQKCTLVLNKAKHCNSNLMILREKMVPIIGVEPTTFALRIIRTTF